MEVRVDKMRKTFIFKEEIFSTSVMLVTFRDFGGRIIMYHDLGWWLFWDADGLLKILDLSPTTVTNIDVFASITAYVINLVFESDTALFSRHQMWNETYKEMVGPSAVEIIDGNYFEIVSSISGSIWFCQISWASK